MYDSLYLCFENDRLVDLLILYKEGLINGEEQGELEYLLQQPGAEEAYALFNTWEEEVDLTAEEEEQLLQQLHHRLGLTNTPVAIEAYETPVKKLPPDDWVKYASAAAVLAAVVIGLVFLKSTFNKQPVAVVVQQQPLHINEQPGLNTAVLTLLDGKQLVMSADRDVVVTIGGNTRVISDHGVLSLQSSVAGKAGGKFVLTTRRASTYSVQLPDGSMVRLNANSSIRFPAAFASGSREVEMLNGEAFFTVQTNATAPFTVKSMEQTITVLGTAFNVQAFAGSGKIVTALLQGKIAVAAGKNTLQLQPGQQTLLLNKELTVQNIADTSAVNQWTKDDDWFEFNNTPLSTVITQLENWYGVPFEVLDNNHLAIRVNARLYKRKSLQGILASLGQLVTVRFIQNKDKIVIK
ncbi:FecR family protein [Filimonas lacunae]|uniref:FecR family protein n=1 Tax=Filimonas lacunae TaxID=477680 RepID=A0A173MJA4_9BACT|nr:FecR family protein [Filimonas lacunae]BAV07694.1 anti-sigma factor [Filimonas lacunae]SIT03616.1 FecR family protein [Filimonas lacunae]